MLDLSGVTGKIDRFEHHFKTVGDEVRQWMETSPYRAIQQCNADFTHYSLVAKLVGTEPDLHRWTLIIGDAIHNLRCSLDHLIYAIAIHQSGQNPPPKEDGLGFPICDSCESFWDAKRRRLFGLSHLAQTVIEAVQPYNRPDKAVPPPLAMLRDFDNADKHKLIRLAYTTPIEGDIGFVGPEHPAVTRVDIAANFGEIKDGAELVSHTFDSPAPDMKYDRIDLQLSVAIYHGKRSPTDPEWKARNDFSAVLKVIGNEVKYVIDRIAAVI
jgi:hypothetical protein